MAHLYKNWLDAKVFYFPIEQYAVEDGKFYVFPELEHWLNQHCRSGWWRYHTKKFTYKGHYGYHLAIEIVDPDVAALFKLTWGG